MVRLQDKLNGAYISRDWSRAYSMDWMQADDVTQPVYFRARDGDGGWVLMRGQVLVAIDLRSTRILAFVLISGRNYYSMAIRTLFNKACADTGCRAASIWRAASGKLQDTQRRRQFTADVVGGD